MDIVLILILLLAAVLVYLLFETSEGELNGWIDRNLAPRGWSGPRNWFGPANPINEVGDVDKNEFFLDILCLTTFIVIFTLAQAYINLIVTGAIYSILVLIMLFFWLGKEKPLPYIGFGDVHKGIRIGVTLGLIWVALCLVSSNVFGQTIVTPAQAISPVQIQNVMLGLAVGALTVIVISYVEGTTFAGNLLPLFASKLGIVFAVILISLLGGMLHYVILQYNVFSIGLTVVRGLIVYPWVLKEQSKTIELSAHTLGNFIAFLIATFFPTF
jgi:membrane protease YdiL (CAAX protease family)